MCKIREHIHLQCSVIELDSSLIELDSSLIQLKNSLIVIQPTQALNGKKLE